MEMTHLRPYQILLSHQLNSSQRIAQLLIAPTGYGKTHLAVAWIRSRSTDTKLVLWICPLTALARQMSLRLQVELPEWEILLGAGPDGVSPPCQVTTHKKTIWIGSPERVNHAEFGSLKKVILVIDEAHTLIEWAHPFRESMNHLSLQLSESRPSTLLLSASPPLEIRGLLDKIFQKNQWEAIGNFSLPSNLQIEVHLRQWGDRLAMFRSIRVKNKNQSTLVFAQNRTTVESLARWHQNHEPNNTVAYHAGISFEEKKLIEQRLSRGESLIIFATSAFGLGMDYPQIQQAVLWQLPPSPLSLVQMMGRAARTKDQLSRAFLFTHPQDLRLLKWISDQSQQNQRNLQAVWDIVCTKTCRTRQIQTNFLGSLSEKMTCGHCDVCSGSIFGNNIGGSEQTKRNGALARLAFD